MSLQGEEVPLVVIEGLNIFWKETRNHRIPNMMMTLKGRFKGENNPRWHCVPLADQTKSGIPTRRCIIWIIYRQCELDNQDSCFLFAIYNGRKASIGDYDPMFRNLLEQGKKMHTEFSPQDFS